VDLPELLVVQKIVVQKWHYIHSVENINVAKNIHI
jgi:hypothetical protein